MRILKSYFRFIVAAGLLFSVTTAFAEPVASVVAVRGKATVERGTKKLDAQPKLGIELQDTVATAEGGRAKLLFIDDSVLTLAEKSRMSVETFVHSRSDRGKSLFNLLDGKMRAVVGKTKFEVKTPTVVAAARGTVILFDVGTVNGAPYTRITCLEGVVDVRSLTDAVGTPPVMLSAGQSIVVTTGLPMPTPTQMAPAELEKLKKDTSTSGTEIKLPEMQPREALIGTVGVTPITPIPVAPPFDRQQPAKPQPSKVDIGVKF
jgi:hypothetical protein